jgi:LmbE family N-acetylglucosaminyl deacetylase
MSYNVFAIAAHPDDIEFGMAGTMILLSKAGCKLHYMNIANGSCGTSVYDTETIVKMRFEEAKEAAQLIGAHFHPPLVPDLEIYYERSTLALLSSVVREVKPDILLIPSPKDYMEDHMNVSRLAVTAAFARGMRNFLVNPQRDPVFNDVAVYHAQPHGNRDELNHPVNPDLFIDIIDVIEKKTEMLACHRSQKEWLDKSQGFDSYLNTMKEHSGEVGEMSGKFTYAEGWRRRNPTGFCSQGFNPLVELLKDYVWLKKVP